MIPLIGQPTIVEWSVTLVVKCPCGKATLLQGKVGALAACECGNGFGLGPFESDKQNPRELIVSLGVGRVEKK